MEKKLTIFVSYTTKDLESATRLHDALKAHNFDVWFAPESLKEKGGDYYTNEIVKGLNSADLFLIVVSENSMNSPEVNSELNLAFHHPKYIIPVRLDRSELLGNFAYFLGSRNRIETSDPINQSDINRVIDSIEDWKVKPKTPDMVKLIIDDYIGRGDQLMILLELHHLYKIYVLPTLVNMETNAKFTGHMALRSIVENEAPIIVSADAGIGKSVFAKSLILETITKNKENVDTVEECIPFIIELGKEFGVEDVDKKLEDVILKNLNSYVKSFKDNYG